MSKAIADKNNIAKVSESLFEYCKKSNTLIKEFGGQTIFAGGDDLLFFAPIVSKDSSKTIFELCDDISNDFSSKISDATLSFGISVNYVKYPLYEAVENSRELLFEKAKNEHKNNIAFRVTKHSGQTFETIIHKGNREVYDNFLIFSSNIKSGKDMDNFLHSIHHKIDTYKTTIDLIANDKQRIKNFFDNYFNKDIHEEYQGFFTALIDFIYEVYQDNSIKNDEKLNIVYATLRFIKFVQGDKS
jgi:CRISPR-associated protein Cmr2